ncbi:MAG TPA: cytochrome c oxidase assembly protein [Chloroflexota bacterium]|nr:cytochrome c oxidase assembly protein [Chloroflexota bacterium]
MLLQVQPTGDFSWTSWHGEPSVRAGILLLAGLYLLGVGPLRRRYALGPPAPRWKIATFLAGIAILFVALDGPLDDLSDNYLFSAHMLQHMLLTLFMPPLLLMGTPGWLLRPLIGLPFAARVARALTQPLVALLLFNVTFTVFHLPSFFELTLEDERFHIAEHVLFMVTAIITWWPILSPLPELPRLPYPVQLIYVFFQTFSGFTVGAFLTLAQQVLYPFYQSVPRLWGVSALDDQKIGGLIMWVIGGTFLLLVFTAIFFAWVSHEHVQDEVVEPPAREREPGLAPPNRGVVGARPDKP